jgi:Xaa-Pro aminopeptidase
MTDIQRLAAAYTRRRRALAERVGKGIILIAAGGPAPDRLLPDENLNYLTGSSERAAYLLIAPEGVMVERAETRGGPEMTRGRKVHDILFVEEQSEGDKFMDGARPSLDDIRERSGLDRVYPIAKLNDILQTALMYVDTLWLNAPATPILNAPLNGPERLAQQIRERFYWLQFRNVAPLIHDMRWVKDEIEVGYLREAFQIHTELFEEMMRRLKPGTNESLGQAIWEYGIACRPEHVTFGMPVTSYESPVIVGSGPNSVIPHHVKNNRTIEDGDLVLLDSGVNVHGYSSDITRTFPANGRFTPRQRELYAMVLEAENAAIATMRPGSTMLQAMQAVYDTFERYGVAAHSYGNCGHPVGLNIHDACNRYPDDREQPLQPGVVVVIEPFLMMWDEGIGIRIEDGVLITENGHELLAGPPREIDEIEAFCSQL